MRPIVVISSALKSNKSIIAVIINTKIFKTGNFYVDILGTTGTYGCIRFYCYSLLQWPEKIL